MRKVRFATATALGAVSFGMFASVGTAAADGHNVVNPDATWGSADGPEQRGQDIVPAIQSIDTSATVLGNNTPVSSYPAAPNNLPVSSYPADPSWPGVGFGAADD
ncbi:hypothetical protein ACXPWS_10690 [Mycobacterium sp. BMJ-28]